jgi:hypothetical protein
MMYVDSMKCMYVSQRLMSAQAAQTLTYRNHDVNNKYVTKFVQGIYMFIQVKTCMYMYIHLRTRMNSVHTCLYLHMYHDVVHGSSS